MLPMSMGMPEYLHEHKFSRPLPVRYLLSLVDPMASIYLVLVLPGSP